MVNRKTLTANTVTDFNFNTKGETIYTVLNFTEDYAYVFCECGVFDESKSYKIPSNTARIIKTNSNKLQVKAIAGGEIEIDE